MAQLKIALMKRRTSPDGIRQEGIVERIVKIVESNPDVNILAAPEWLFLRKHPTEKLYSNNEKNRILERIAERTKNRDTLIIPGTIGWEDDDEYYRNTAFLLYKGDVIGEYHKMTSGGDHKIAETCFSTFKPGTEPGVFCWHNLRLGLEICMDHDRRVLKKAVDEKQIDPVDLQLIVSCGMDIGTDELAVRRGGFVALTDGLLTESKTWIPTTEVRRYINPHIIFTDYRHIPEITQKPDYRVYRINID